MQKIAQDTRIIAMDLYPTIASVVQDKTGVQAVAADAGHLPFRSESISAVNASALFHEASSYGIVSAEGGIRVWGMEAIMRVMDEVKRVLMPGGVLGYRDVLAPYSGIPGDDKTVKYGNGAWRQYIEWFVDGFFETEPKYYPRDRFKMSSQGECTVIEAPAGLQREIQRHFIMMRDFTRNVLGDEFGIKIHSFCWQDEEKGIKQAIVSSYDATMRKFIEERNYTRRSSAEGDRYEINSDELDKLYDDAIDYRFSQRTNGHRDVSLWNNMNGWKMREGTEHYCYASITELLRQSLNRVSDDGYILFPVKADEVSVAPRNYYNRYLKTVIDAPEFDGKQIIGFRKIHAEKGINVLKLLREDSRLRTIVNFNMI